MFLHLDEGDPEDDIEDYGFALDLDDILAGKDRVYASRPTRPAEQRAKSEPHEDDEVSDSVATESAGAMKARTAGPAKCSASASRVRAAIVRPRLGSVTLRLGRRRPGAGDRRLRRVAGGVQRPARDLLDEPLGLFGGAERDAPARVGVVHGQVHAADAAPDHRQRAPTAKRSRPGPAAHWMVEPRRSAGAVSGGCGSQGQRRSTSASTVGRSG